MATLIACPLPISLLYAPGYPLTHRFPEFGDYNVRPHPQVSMLTFIISHGSFFLALTL